MARNLEEQMQPLFQQIGSALLAATPEWWTAATLRVEVEHQPDGNVGLSHSIWSDRHPQDVVQPTEEIAAATRTLQGVCEQGGKSWAALLFSIEQVEGRWNFAVHFQYPEKGNAVGTEGE